jgi:hypothetical protein
MTPWVMTAAFGDPLVPEVNASMSGEPAVRTGRSTGSASIEARSTGQGASGPASRSTTQSAWSASCTTTGGAHSARTWAVCEAGTVGSSTTAMWPAAMTPSIASTSGPSCVATMPIGVGSSVSTRRSSPAAMRRTRSSSCR